MLGVTLGKGFLGGSVVKNLPANAGDAEPWFQSLGKEDPLEEEMETCSSSLAWEIPWTEEPVGLLLDPLLHGVSKSQT